MYPVEFIRFVMSEAGQKKLATYRTDIPVLRSVANTPEFLNYPVAKKVPCLPHRNFPEKRPRLELSCHPFALSLSIYYHWAFFAFSKK